MARGAEQGSKIIRQAVRRLRRGDNAGQMDAMDTLARFGPLATEAVPALTRLLDDYVNCVRARAAEVLGRIGPASAPAVTKLNSMLDDHSPAVKSAVARALTRIGPVGLPELLESFLFEEEHSRIQAAKAIAALGSDAREAVPILTDALRDKSARIRKEVARTLASLGASLTDKQTSAVIDTLKREDAKNRPALAEHLASFPGVGKPAVAVLRRLLSKEPKPGDDDLRPAVIQALGKMGQASKPVIPELIALAKTESPLRTAALTALGRLGETSQVAVPDLVESLAGAGEKRTLQIIDTLGRIGPASAPAVPALIGLLPNAYGALRESITRTLARIGPEAGAAIPTLLTGVTDPTATVRAEAVRALGHIAGSDREAIGAMVRVLLDPDAEVRRSAIEALSKTQTDARKLAPYLNRCLADRDASVRRAAARWLAVNMGRNERIVARCRKAINSPYREVRYEAGEFLWLFTRRSDNALPILREQLADSRRAIRHAALGMLREAAERDGRALDLLVQALGNPDEPLGRPAATALIGYGSKSVGPLLKALESPQSAIRAGALYALSGIEKLNDSALPALLKSLDDEEEEVRWSAVRVLAQMRRSGEQIIAALVPLLSDEVASVRSWAALALSRFRERAVAAVRPVLKQPLTRAQEAACRALALIGPAALPAAPDLGPLLRETNEALRTAANRVLDQVSGDIKAEVEPLLRLLRRDNRAYQEWAARMLKPYGERVLPLLMREMGEGEENYDDDQIWGATEGLARLGEQAAPAVPLILRILEAEDTEPELRERLGVALSQVGVPAIPALIDALNHANPEVRLGAIDALSRLGPAASEAVPGLIELMHRETSPGVQRFIAEALADIGDAGIIAVAEALSRAHDPEAAARLAQAIGVIGAKSKPGLPALRQALSAEDPVVRREALWAIRRVGLPAENPAELLDALADAIADLDPRVHELAPFTLGSFGTASVPTFPKLLKFYEHSESAVRRSAILAVGEILRTIAQPEDLRPLAGEVLPPTRARLRDDPDSDNRAEAIRTLAALCAADPAAVRSALSAALPESPVLLQVRIIEALGQTGREAERDLRRALDHPNALVRRAAFLTIVSRQPDDLIALATDHLRDTDWVISRDSARILGEQGDAAREAIPALCEALQSKLRETRTAALESLKKLDPDGAQTLPALLAGLGHASPEVRAWTAEHVGQFQEKAVEAVPMLVLLGQDHLFNMGNHARTSLQQIGAAAAAGFKEVLTHKNKKVRERAFNVLRMMDWQAANTLQAYTQQLGDPPPDVNRKLDNALNFLAAGGAAGGSEIKNLLRNLRSKQGWWEAYHAAMRLNTLATENQIPDEAIPGVVEALSKALSNNDSDVRREAARAIGAFGPKGASAAGALTERLSDPNRQTRRHVIVALSRVGEVPKETIQTLIKMLNPKKNSAGDLQVAADLLSRQGASAAAAETALKQNLKHKSPDVRMWSAWALASIKGEDAGAAKEVKKLLTAPHPRLQAWGGAAYYRLTRDAEAVLPVIDRVLPCHDADCRNGLINLASAIGEPAQAQLFAALNHEDAAVRRGAVLVLGGLGERSESVLAALERASEDFDADVRQAATEALTKLRSGEAIVVPSGPGAAEEGGRPSRVAELD